MAEISVPETLNFDEARDAARQCVAVLQPVSSAILVSWFTEGCRDLRVVVTAPRQNVVDPSGNEVLEGGAVDKAHAKIISALRSLAGLHRRAYLARNARKPNRVDDEDPLLAGSSSPALEEYRRWRAKLAELDVEQRQEELLPRDMVHEGLGRLASILRRAGEALNRQFGSGAHRLLDDALVDAQREIETLVGGDSGNDKSGGGD